MNPESRPTRKDITGRRIVASFRVSQLRDIADAYLAACVTSADSLTMADFLNTVEENKKERYRMGLVVAIEWLRGGRKLEELSEVLIWQKGDDVKDRLVEHKMVNPFSGLQSDRAIRAAIREDIDQAFRRSLP